uniref:Uncharacterized protein n=1 Tax=Romanomermis culicivorax TaxID=13658 RepID=A0A915KST1_ROMCU
MKPIYEHITLDEDNILMEILEDITSDEDEVVVDEDLENITFEEEEEVEEEEEKTLYNISDEEGTILDYDNDANNQYKSYTLHSSNQEKIYQPVQIGSGGITNLSFVVDDFFELDQPSTMNIRRFNTQG